MLDHKNIFNSDKLLDEVLKTEPDYSLPGNFAGMVADKVGRRLVWNNYLKEFLIYLAVIAGITLVSAGMALVWYDADWKNWLDFLVSNTGFVAGINIIVVFILFADRVLLRYFMYKSSLKNDV